jgi:hypothetical protein
MTAEASPTALLFFTSRTARDDYFFCPFYRYLSKHWGPQGYGIQPQRQSVPLATGARVHDIFHPVLEWVRDKDELPPQHLTASASLNALTIYNEDVRQHGMSYWGDETAYLRMIEEQKHLIAGLPMLWFRHQLPILLQDWRIVLVEPREVSVYRCTCELGDGVPPWQSHVERGCQGIGLQTGPDFIAQHRQSGSYRYDEFKTRSAPLTDAWGESFETRVQVQLGTLGIEQKYGIEIEQVYLHGLCKGQYRSNKELGEYQDSRLCWAWRKPPSPPLVDEEWAEEYEWWDEMEQRKRRLGKGWVRTWVGDYPGGLSAWIDRLPEATVAKMLRIIGPLQRNPVAKADALSGWIGLEEDIRWKLGEIHELLAEKSWDWTHPEVQEQLSRMFPKSWDCQRFGKRYGCSMIPICHRHPGWQDPFSIGFVNRRPHHDPELQQAVARGLLPADEVYEGEEAT